MYKHLTSIKKRQEEKTAHTQNGTPERNDQKGAAQHPEKQQVERTGEKNKGGEIDNDTIVSWVKFRATMRAVVMQDRPASLTILLDNNQVDQRGRWRGQ